MNYISAYLYLAGTLLTFVWLADENPYPSIGKRTAMIALWPVMIPLTGAVYAALVLTFKAMEKRRRIEGV